MKKMRSGCLAVVGLFVILVIAGIVSSGSNSKKSSAQTRARQESPAATAAKHLASVDGGSQGQAPELTRDLTALRSKCQETPNKLAGEIYASEQDLRKHNIDLDAVGIAGQLRKITFGLRKSSEPTDCASLLAAYLVLRETRGSSARASTATLGGSTSTTATSTAASTTSPPPSGRCGDITVNQHTTCPFARNVVRAYNAGSGDTVDAYSPVTKQEYTLTCTPTGGKIRCVSGAASLSFPSSDGASSNPTTAPATSPASTIEQAGSYSHATDSQFCDSSGHVCIENFPNGNGYIVQCADGEWSHSGGLSGACSDHGGES